MLYLFHDMWFDLIHVLKTIFVLFAPITFVFKFRYLSFQLSGNSRSLGFRCVLYVPVHNCQFAFPDQGF